MIRRQAQALPLGAAQRPFPYRMLEICPIIEPSLGYLLTLGIKENFMKQIAFFAA